ncbi:MAG: AAA family ATPase [bacterium]|nr:AAA family ATPase [bacterium]
MYGSLSIRNFRCFREIELGDLERVNLIAGKNNVGKTALLEALFLHSGPANASLAAFVNQLRGIPIAPRDPESAWRSLFHDLNLGEAVELSSTDSDGASRSLRIFPRQEEAVHVPLEEPGAKAPNEGRERAVSGPVVGRSLVFEHRAPSEEPRTSRFFFDGRGFRIEPPPPPPPFPGIFQVAAGQPDLQGDADRYGSLQRQKRERRVLELLRIIEPRLEGLAVIPIDGVLAVHGDIGLSALVPVPLMGGGMARLFSMAVAVGIAEGGVVLIDEIENGIYHASMAKVWEALGAFARHCDTQLFCTTHSFECIASAHEAFEKSGQYDFRLHRLEQMGEEIRAVTYDQETLGAAIESGLEVR